jgi:hypothetical protein
MDVLTLVLTHGEHLETPKIEILDGLFYGSKRQALETLNKDH